MNILGKFFERKCTIYYNKLKNSKFINDIYNYIHLLFSILKKEKKLFIFFVKNTFLYYILKNTSDVTFEFRGNKIMMPRHLKGLNGFIEVWSDHFYDKIEGYNHVLDLGGYIGDSALKFAQNNKKVSVYEAHPENFKYLQKNTENFKNISAYNKAVVGDENEKFIKIYGGSFNMGAGNGHYYNGGGFIKVPAISILSVLRKNKFDALKMDIEGAEYDCFDAIMNSNENNFFFKEGFIEFHLSKNKTSDIQKIQKIINWLEKKNYNTKYYDVIFNKYFNSLKEIKNNVFLVHFYKK